MKLDKNTYGTVLLVYALSAAVLIASYKLVDSFWLNALITIALVWFCGWQTMFHMVPVREISGSDSIVTAVADGKIVHIGKVYEKEWLKQDMTMISIYMDFWDVHANFWPVTGTVTYYKYHPGKHILAFKPKASEENEHTCTSIRTESGDEVFFKQLAGGFARRIVNYASDGLDVEVGSQCGIIKFGSRIDMFVPLDADIMVEMGQTVRACETPIARLS